MKNETKLKMEFINKRNNRDDGLSLFNVILGNKRSVFCLKSNPQRKKKASPAWQMKVRELQYKSG